MAFFCPQLFDSILSLSTGEALVLIGWILTVHCSACRGILVHPDFLTIAGGSSYHGRVAEQQYKAVLPTAKSSVTQNSVPRNLPASACRAQKGSEQLWLQRGHNALFSQRIPALWQWEGFSSTGVGMRGGEDPLSPLH